MYRETRRAARQWGIPLAFLALLALAAGCGGGKSLTTPGASAPGSAVVSVNWPARGADSRVIPAAAESIVFRLFTDRELTELDKVVARPSGGGTVSVHFDGLPSGPVLFLAEARSLASGGGDLLAGGAQTVSIRPGGSTPVSIGLAAPAVGSNGRAVLIVNNIPAAAVSVRLVAVLNGQAVGTGDGSISVARVSDAAFAAVPFGLVNLAGGPLSLVATALDSTGAVIAAASDTIALSANGEITSGLALVAGATGGSSGGQGGQTSTGAVVLNVSNIAQGDTKIVVESVPADTSLPQPADVTIQLPSSVTSGVVISQVPVLVSGLQAGPWLFVVTSRKPDNSITRAGSVTSDVTAGERKTAVVPLGSTSLGTTPQPDGTLNVTVSNITNQDAQSLAVGVFDSAGLAKDPVVVAHTPGVNARVVTFSVPAGAYTVVAAAFKEDVATVRAAYRTTVPTGALALGSSIVNVVSAQADGSTVELRTQGLGGVGTVNLAMLQVPVLVKADAPNVVVSSATIRAYTLSDNQEITSVKRLFYPHGVSGIYRLRLDGVPTGLLRFEVQAWQNETGGGGLIGSGSTIADVRPTVSSSDPVVTAVTVTVLPHGPLPPGTILPGASNVDPDNQNPEPAPARTAYLRRFFRWPGR